MLVRLKDEYLGMYWDRVKGYVWVILLDGRLEKMLGEWKGHMLVLLKENYLEMH